MLLPREREHFSEFCISLFVCIPSLSGVVVVSTCFLICDVWSVMLERPAFTEHLLWIADTRPNHNERCLSRQRDHLIRNSFLFTHFQSTETKKPYSSVTNHDKKVLSMTADWIIKRKRIERRRNTKKKNELHRPPQAHVSANSRCQNIRRNRFVPSAQCQHLLLLFRDVMDCDCCIWTYK